MGADNDVVNLQILQIKLLNLETVIKKNDFATIWTPIIDISHCSASLGSLFQSNGMKALVDCKTSDSEEATLFNLLGLLMESRKLDQPVLHITNT